MDFFVERGKVLWEFVSVFSLPPSKDSVKKF